MSDEDLLMTPILFGTFLTVCSAFVGFLYAVWTVYRQIGLGLTSVVVFAVGVTLIMIPILYEEHIVDE